MTAILRELVGQAVDLASTVADMPSPPPPPPPPPPAPPPRPAPAARPSGRAAGGSGGGITPTSLLLAKAKLRPVKPSAPEVGPPVAFSFSVVFSDERPTNETSFQEVSGIDAELGVEEVRAGGENRYALYLPTGVKYQPLVLKRGIGAAGSPLVRWCRETMEGGLGRRIRTMPISVYLLDPQFVPVCGWHFANAYPTHWQVGGFDAMKNDLAIETVTFRYSYSNRIL